MAVKECENQLEIMEPIQKIKIAEKYVGQGEPVFIVAEIGQNHNGDMQIAKALIDQCAHDKVSAVKFCKRHIKSDLAKSKYNSLYPSQHSFGATYGQHREFLELSKEQHQELKEYANAKGLVYFASVCDLKSADDMDDIGIPMFKIASRDLTNKPLIEHVAKKQKPIFLSTGMSNLSEVERTINLIRKYHNQIIIFQCTSEYPAKYEDINLNAMAQLKNHFGLQVGMSDHSSGIMVACAAAAMGAVAIEKHVTLDRNMKGTDHQASLDPPGMERLVTWIRNFEVAKGASFKSMLEGEFVARKKLARSIVAARPLKAGQTILVDMLAAKTHVDVGLNPFEEEKILGKTLLKDIDEDELILEHQVS